MSAVIRRATPDDARAMSAIAQIAFGESLEPDPARLAMALNRGVNFVAVSNGRVSGFVGNFMTRAQEAARCASNWICWRWQMMRAAVAWERPWWRPASKRQNPRTLTRFARWSHRKIRRCGGSAKRADSRVC